MSTLGMERHDIPTFEYQDKDDADGPSFWWVNPYSGRRECVARLFWPEHPGEATEAIEHLFESLSLTAFTESDLAICECCGDHLSCTRCDADRKQGEIFANKYGLPSMLQTAPTSPSVNAGLLEALKPFAAIADNYSDKEDDDFQILADVDVLAPKLLLHHFREARRATAESAQAATAGESARATATTSPSVMENGWVIEHRNSPGYEPRYWTGNGWSKDNLAAIRFAREIDAQNTANGFDEDDPLPSEGEHRIAEHGWYGPRLTTLRKAPAGDDLAWLDEIEARTIKDEQLRSRRDLTHHDHFCVEDRAKLVIALRQALSRHKDDAGKVTEAMRDVLKTASLLYQNAEGCAVNHYGADFSVCGIPGWLADCKDSIERGDRALQAALAPTEGER